MDKDKITGLVLISILFMVYMFFFAPEPPAPAPQQQAPTSQAADAQASAQPAEAALPDSLRQAQMSQRWGAYAAAMQGDEQEIVLENELVRIALSSRGGIVKSVLLKEYKTYHQQPLYLVEEGKAQFSLQTQTERGPIDLHSLYYSPQTRTTEAGQQVVFSLNLPNGAQVQHAYTLPADSYQLQYDLKTSGMSQQAPLEYRWQQRLRNLERDIDDSRTRTTLNYYTLGEDYEELDRHTTGLEEEQIGEPIKWVGINHRFFTAALIARDGSFSSGAISANIPANDTSFVKHADIRLQLSDSVAQAGGSFTYFFGPNNYYMLRKVTDGFGQNVHLGYFILRPINKWLIIPVFHFLEQFISNYGIIIFLLVLFIKLLLFPLTYKSYMGMAKMRVLKPQIDELKEKHGDDPMKMQQEQMKLYSQLGINPISGCLPMLLQMPILFAMFYFFPNSIELRQEQFLWANDLSTYDSIVTLPFKIPFYGDHVSLFCLLMTVSTIIYTHRNQQMSAAVQGPMKTLSYIMPITFLFFLNSFPAALTYYYFVSNIVTFAQQDLIRRFVDDNKILAMLERNRLKNKDKKKGGFQARLEEALKASQEAQRQQKDEKQARKPKK
ncbi:membrane protein insertase YidC [Cesiribacter andamanensis]|uniref:Membrane protein insertase YidC n=1 Tax=Cesiribacter andamanensis AMV16 TaxID=1279009 RepID=M7NIW4_9BACT|nr:membrane protein insertase YidC [Cesiribacter andamanensis]EMR01700.1 Oxa1Ec [Cesiribacter andamanensis AMV16]